MAEGDTPLMKLKWSDPEGIGIALHEKFPDKRDVFTIRHTELHQWITELEEFDDDHLASSEAKLEAVQTAWNDEIEESGEL